MNIPIFKKKPVAAPMPSPAEQIAEGDETAYEEQIVEEPRPIAPVARPVQAPVARPEPQQPELTEDILRQIIIDFNTRLANIEAKLFRSGL